MRETIKAPDLTPVEQQALEHVWIHTARWLDLADRIICPSDNAASLIHTRTPIEIIRGGVDSRFFAPPSQPWPRDRVLYVGRPCADFAEAAAGG